MTQDPQIILKGLKCCSQINCLCEECPFCQTEVHCRELESDAAKLITYLLEKISNHESKLVEMNNKFSEGDFAEGLRLLIVAVKEIERTDE